MNLILLEPGEVADTRMATVADHRAAHLRRVLAVTVGQQVRIGLVDGPRGVGTVSAVTPGQVELRCDFDDEVPSRPPVDLLLALPRPKVMRRLWAQLAAIGVGRIMLTNAERVERDYFATHLLEPASYRPLLIEGLQQARDTRLPIVSVHRRFKVLVEDELDSLAESACRLVAHPAGGQAMAVAAGHARGGRVLLAVGPEGGWNAFELRLLEQHGFTRVGMGERTLRTDTACIGLLVLVHSALAGHG